MIWDHIVPILNLAALVIAAWVGRSKIMDLHVLLNSRLTELLEATKKAGASEEREAQAVRAAASEGAEAIGEARGIAIGEQHSAKGDPL
jgi:hypothetical protein